MKRWHLLSGLLIVTIVWLQVRLWIGEGSFAHVDALSTRVEQKRVTNEVKALRNVVMLAEIRDLKSGLDSIEEIARSEFGLIKKGETFFLVIDE